MTRPLRPLERLIVRLDHYQRRRRAASFVVAVIKKYNDDEAGQRAALLAYYGFLSLFPLLLVLTSVFKLLLHNQSALGSQLLQGSLTYFPAVGRELQQNIGEIQGTGVALVLGLIIALYGARGVGDGLRSSLDHVWHVAHAERSPFPVSLLRSMAIIIGGGLSLALAPIISGYMLVFSPNRLSSVLSPVLLAAALFCIIVYVVKVGSSVYRHFREIWVGSAIAAVSLEILQSVGGVIMAHQLQRLDSLYGTFALVLGLMFWIFLQTQVLLWAFEIDSVRVFHLWPRSLYAPLTNADYRAFRLYSDRAQFHRESLQGDEGS